MSKLRPRATDTLISAKPMSIFRTLWHLTMFSPSGGLKLFCIKYSRKVILTNIREKTFDKVGIYVFKK